MFKRKILSPSFPTDVIFINKLGFQSRHLRYSRVACEADGDMKHELAHMNDALS